MKALGLTLRSSALAALVTLSGISPLALAQDSARATISVSPGIADITSLDPHRASLVGDKGIVAEMFNALVRFLQAVQIQPRWKRISLSAGNPLMTRRFGLSSSAKG